MEEKSFNYGSFVSINNGKISKHIIKPNKLSATNSGLNPQDRLQTNAADYSAQNSASINFIPLEKTKATKRKKKYVKFPISAKLIGIISTIVILSLGSITFLVSHFVSADTKLSAEENNFTINNRTANDCETRFNSVVSL